MNQNISFSFDFDFNSVEFNYESRQVIASAECACLERSNDTATGMLWAMAWAFTQFIYPCHKESVSLLLKSDAVM